VSGRRADVTVRDARPADREAAHALTRDAYAQYATRMAPAAWAGLAGALDVALAAESRGELAGAERIVAEHEGRVVGTVLLIAPGTDAYQGAADCAPWPEVRLLAVDPAARGLGVGRALMDECVRRAHLSGARTLGLHTSASMREAMTLYRAMGFVRAPEDDFRPEGAELVEGYRLSLGAEPDARHRQ
jgi:GNAT superfamily N-acetyltransferase